MLARLEKYTDKKGVEKEEIKIYNKLPNSFKAGDKLIAGGSSAFTKEQVQGFGFYELITPDYDARVEELSNLHLDGDVYTYDVIDLPITETLSKLKENKINQSKSIIGNMLSLSDWYIIREADSGEPTPQEVKDDRATLRQRSAALEAEIIALTTKKSVVLFDINI